MLDPEYRELYLGRIEIKKIFKVNKVGNVAGCVVVDGKAKPDASVRILRDNVVIYEGKLASLKRFQDDANEVVAGQECGLGIENFNDIKEGDTITVKMNEHVDYNGKTYPIAALPENLMDIIQAGGLVKAMRKRNGLD